MRFRYFSFSPIYKSTVLAKFSPKPPRNSIVHPLLVQSSATKLLGISSPTVNITTNGGSTSSRIFRRWHFGHSHGGPGHQHDRTELGSSKESENIFRLGLAADIGLSVGKAITGYLTGSTAIIADAAHSLSDVVLSGVALVSFKAARVPKDKEHPYGHGKFETLGALGISCMLVATAGGIGWHAIDVLMGVFTAAPEAVHSLAHDHQHQTGGLQHGIDMEHPILALNMTILSIAIKEGLFWITKRAGEKEGSGLMKANAWHHRADAVSSLVALVGGSILGIKILDPVAGLVVSGMILKAGLESGYQSILELVDAAIPQQELELHRQTILKGCHQLRGRRAGSFLYLDVHIEVDPFTSVSDAHHVGETVRRRLHESHPEVSEIFIHIDPSISEVLPDAVHHEEDRDGEHQSYVDVDSSMEHKDLDDSVTKIFMSKFREKVVVEHITRHVLQGKLLLEIEVSMPPDTMIQDAMQMADAAREDILKMISNVIEVSIQLRLSQFHHKFP
ncbi:hypothetical protein V2J09_009248 [Rumex salicifolius]